MMSGRRFNRKRRTSQEQIDDIPVSSSSTLFGNTFRDYQCILDEHYDRYERLVKISRDITIESKRIIFQLHRIPSGSGKAQLKGANRRLEDLRQHCFFRIAQELLHQDQYKYLRAFVPGLEEYIEALTFAHYLETGSLLSLDEIQRGLVFPEKIKKREVDSTRGHPATTLTDADSLMPDGADRPGIKYATDQESPRKEHSESYPVAYVLVTPANYLLGIADLTGELMRAALRSMLAPQQNQSTASADNTARVSEAGPGISTEGSAGHCTESTVGLQWDPQRLCECVRRVHDAFVRLSASDWRLPRKLVTMAQSLQKMERVCYSVRMRLAEFPDRSVAELMHGFDLEAGAAGADGGAAAYRAPDDYIVGHTASLGSMSGDVMMT